MSTTEPRLDVQHLWFVCRDRLDEDSLVAGRSDIGIRASSRSRYERLRDVLPTGVVELHSADVARFRQTATRLFPNQKWESSEHLLPRDMGSWEGLSWDAIRKEEPMRNEQFWSDAEHGAAPNGETLPELVERLRLFRTSLVHRDDWENAVIVVDPDAVRATLADLLEVPLRKVATIVVEPLGVAHLTHSWFGWSLVGLDQVP